MTELIQAERAALVSQLQEAQDLMSDLQAQATRLLAQINAINGGIATCDALLQQADDRSA